MYNYVNPDSLKPSPRPNKATSNEICSKNEVSLSKSPQNKLKTLGQRHKITISAFQEDECL